jgi:hypothetical protein
MRKIIIATAALAFLSSTAFAQDKGAAPAAGDSMSKGEMSKMSKKSHHKKKSSAKSGEDSMSKQ